MRLPLQHALGQMLELFIYALRERAVVNVLLRAFREGLQSGELATHELRLERMSVQLLRLLELKFLLASVGFVVQLLKL